MVRYDRHEFCALSLAGNLLEMAPQDDVTHEIAVMGCIIHPSGSSFYRSLDLVKSRLPQSLGRTFRVLKQPGLVKPCEVSGKLRCCSQRTSSLPHTRDIGSASALHFQPASGNKHIMQVAEQSIVIEDPVKSGGAHDDIDNSLERQVQKIAGNEIQAIAKMRRQVLARRTQHVLRQINRDDASFWQGLEQLGGEASGAATSIQHSFISA